MCHNFPKGGFVRMTSAISKICICAFSSYKIGIFRYDKNAVYSINEGIPHGDKIFSATFSSSSNFKM